MATSKTTTVKIQQESSKQTDTKLAENNSIKELIKDYKDLAKAQSAVLKNTEKLNALSEEQIELEQKRNKETAKYLLNRKKELENQLQEVKNKKERNNLEKEYDKLMREIRKGTSKQARAARISLSYDSFKDAFIENFKTDKDAYNKESTRKQAGEAFVNYLNTATREGTEALGPALISGFNNLSKVVSKGFEETIKAVDGGIKNAISSRSKYEGQIESRLQGLDGKFFDYSEEMTKVAATLGSNPLISQTKFVENLYSLINRGVAYNVEERALVATLQESLVSTFNAMDENLQRLVRLQQADMTYTQLGSEATLTQFLNGMFRDTSYLNTTYDSVSASLMDAMSLMNVDQATSFGYAVQKWLGSLYSVGMNDSDITAIASGLNALATGSVDQLNGQIGTLLNMSAANAGLSYAELLTEGLDASNINELMKGMITYLQAIAANTRDNVTQAQWSNITGLSRSAFRALNNLSPTDLASIYGSNVNYESALGQFNAQMGQLASRTSLAAQVENLLNNTWYSMGTEIANDTGKYLRYYGGQLLSNVFGNGIAGDLIKVLANADTYINGISSLINSGVDIANLRTAIPTFGAAATTGRGGIAQGLSESASFVSNVFDETPIDFSTTSATTLSTISDGSYLTSRTVSDIYYKLFESGSSINVRLTSVDDRAIEDLSNTHREDIDDIKTALGNNTTSITGALGSLRNL